MNNPNQLGFLLGNENEVLAEDASTDANFGWSVSIDRSIAVVGAYIEIDLRMSLNAVDQSGMRLPS